MQKYFIIILVSFLSNIAKAQVKLEYIEIINNSSQITYLGLTYQPSYNLFKPDFDFINSGLATLTQRYEANFNLCKHEYQKLMGLKLINENNIAILKSYQNAVERWAKENFHKYDLSQPQNTNNVLNYITNAFKVQSIKNEIEILQEVNNTYLMVPKISPLIACQNDMYSTIDKFCDEIKSYSSSQLSLGMQTLFTDFLNKRADRNKKINETRKEEILKKYSSNITFSSIADGWKEVEFISVSPIPSYEGSNTSWHYTGKMKVFVSNNRVSQIINRDGSATNIDLSSPIYKQKVDILIPDQRCSDGKVVKIPYTLYF